MLMVMLVLDDPEKLDAVLAAWAALGVSGVTIVESTGVHRYKKQQRLPFRFGFEGQAPTYDEYHYTLFSIVNDEAMARQCLAVTEKITGDLDNPDTGVLAVWPLTLVKGVSLK